MILERIWLLTIEALDGANTPVTLRFASGDYTDPSNNYYDLRIKQPALFTSGAYTGSVIQTGSRTAFGETVLVNVDGGLDYLADYAVDGRAAVLSLRDEDGIITPIIEGTVQNLSFDNTTVSVRLRDPQEQLSINHPVAEYLGNNSPPNGVEGTADDIKGRIKPKVYGKVRNASPILVNSVQLIYEVHDYSVSSGVNISVVSVYDRGVPLTFGTARASLAALYAGTPAAGTYDTYLGYIKLGSAATGTITADADSNKFLLGDVFELLAIEAGYTLLGTSKTALNALGTVGYYMTDKVTTASLFDLLASSVGGYWAFSAGSITEVFAKQLVAPSSPTVFFEDYQIASISRANTGAGKNGIPVYKVKLKADKVETVQTDLAGAVTDALKARLAVQYREALFESSATRTRHPLSEEIEITSVLRILTEAQTQAQRIQTLLGSRRDAVKLTVRLNPDVVDSIQIGTVVNVKSYKFGYSAGKDFIVLGYTLDARLSRVELELFG